MKIKPIPIGLIGITGFGAVYLRILRSLEEEGLVKLVCATVINQQEIEEVCLSLEAVGCRLYANFREMLNEEKGKVEICFIPTGIPWHSSMTIAALEAGCHVIVEKPAAALVSEVEAMEAASERVGKSVIVGFQDLMLDSTLEAKKELMQGAIGRIRSIRVMACWPRSVEYYTRNNWAGRIRSEAGWVHDSPVNNALSHYLMMALFFVTPDLWSVAPVRQVEADLYRAQAIENFDTASLRMTTVSGVSIHFTVTHSNLETLDPVMEIRGEKGAVLWETNRRFLFSPVEIEIAYPTAKAAREEAMRNAIGAISRGEEFGCSLGMAKQLAQIVETLHKQARISTVSPDHLIERYCGGSKQVAIKNIERDVRECFSHGKLFSEMNLSWTSKDAICSTTARAPGATLPEKK